MIFIPKLWNPIPAVRSLAPAILLLGIATGLSGVDQVSMAATDPTAADSIAAAIPQESLRRLIGEVLENNPSLAQGQATAQAVARQAPQAGALPDPMVGVTGFIDSPETRVGPQQAMFALSQKLPWFGKLDLRRRAALRSADAEFAGVDAVRLQLVTQTRTLYYELSFLRSYEQVVRADRAALEHYEELSRTRYASGVGLEQAVVKLQAEITKADARLIDISTRRASLTAQVNALRDRPDTNEVAVDSLPAYREIRPDLKTLRAIAQANRPELAQSGARIERTRELLKLARKESMPDLTLGLTYTLVGDRTDPAGRMVPPPDNGKDVLGVTAAVNLPIWRGRIKAGVDEAEHRRRAAEEGRRAVIASINQSLDDLIRRVPLAWDRLRLYEDELSVQADQSMRSAEAGYAAGTLGALDLLDAERVLLDVRTATARARADYAVAVAQLEGAVGAPVTKSEP